jgi:hypothetical protein
MSDKVWLVVCLAVTRSGWWFSWWHSVLEATSFVVVCCLALFVLTMQ